MLNLARKRWFLADRADTRPRKQPIRSLWRLMSCWTQRLRAARNLAGKRCMMLQATPHKNLRI
jgi:hypothetical protein